MEQKKNIIKINILICFLVAICLVVSIFTLPINFALAENETIKYTNVLVDLYKDDNFNVDEYPMVEDDPSLKVIQIAESSNKELFVYVYNPSTDRTATQISLSTAEDKNNPDFNFYNLKFLNSYEVFSKYKVEGLTVKNVAERKYEITEIFRKFDSNVDKDTGSDNTINEVTYPVSQLWTVTTQNGETKYLCEETKVIEITGKYAGYLRFKNANYFPTGDFTDAHFVAFSTNIEIEEVLSAKVYYVETRYKHIGGGLFGDSRIEIIGGPKEKASEFDADDEGELLNSNSWFPANHSFKRIVSVEEFKEIENLKNTTQESLQGMKWVLRFAETLVTDGGESNEGGTWFDVSNVSILQLKYKADGVVYNIGVVDNKQTGSDEPGNLPERTWMDDVIDFFRGVVNFFKDLWANGKAIMILILSAVVLVALIWILKAIFSKRSK